MKARKLLRPHVLAAGASLLFLVGAAPGTPPANDYPTADRVDYVIGCMAANGDTQEAMTKCSCAIDVIASRMPYKDYDEAKTALNLQVAGGERLTVFANTPQMKALIQNLHRAQAEANIQCFR